MGPAETRPPTSLFHYSGTTWPGHQDVLSPRFTPHSLACGEACRLPSYRLINELRHTHGHVLHWTVNPVWPGDARYACHALQLLQHLLDCVGCVDGAPGGHIIRDA